MMYFLIACIGLFFALLGAAVLSRKHTEWLFALLIVTGAGMLLG